MTMLTYLVPGAESEGAQSLSPAEQLNFLLGGTGATKDREGKLFGL